MIRILLLKATGSEAGKSADSAMKLLGYHVFAVSDAEAALSLLQDQPADLCIAEAEAGGLSLCRDLRDTLDRLPVLILTKNSDIQEIRKIYHAGADGYVLPCVSQEELQLRVKSLLWRCRAENDTVSTLGNISLHAESHTLEAPGMTVELRRMEYLLLEKLLSYPGKIFTRFQLMDDLWGYDCESNPRTIDTHVRRLRKKLRPLDALKIQTIRGIGYRIVLRKGSAE